MPSDAAPGATAATATCATRLSPPAPPAPSAPSAPSDPTDSTTRSRSRRAAPTYIDWATLLRRVYDIDALACPCGGRLFFEKLFVDATAAREELAALGLSPSAAPSAARPDDGLVSARGADAAGLALHGGVDPSLVEFADSADSIAAADLGQCPPPELDDDRPPSGPEAD